MNRYKVIPESVSGHCCFSHTVVDTHKADDVWKDGETVCECFSEKEAQMVCDALNQANEKVASV